MSSVNNLISFFDGMIDRSKPSKTSYLSSYGNYSPIFWPMGGTSNVYIGNNQQDRDYNRQTNAAFLGGLATILFSGLIAYTLKNRAAIQKEVRQARQVYQNLPQLLAQTNLSLEEQKLATKLVTKELYRLEEKSLRSRALHLLTATGLVCAISGFIGGMMAMDVLITASIITTVAAASLAAFYIVWKWEYLFSGNMSTTALADAQRIRSLLGSWTSIGRAATRLTG